ncbi:DDE transposase domain containing protein [Bodo saltans virus]|uniref:DDE transposase domain containing protein n=1 Tax=Bodo saltans virus TaxID=2024608 RepID=A0A2H4UUC8_9VIRU|nr:DDE transposase domain containing protein [Bodo saltans virus]ATZ80530.1 DDE transposase domain containing protein [Bodo saltans virus]
MKIDIYNYILDNLKKHIIVNPTNNKYSVKDIFDSIIFILKSNVSWNSVIFVNNSLIKTNAIYKHFRFLSKINFFHDILFQITNTFLKYDDRSNIFLTDTTFIFNKKCKIHNIKRNPYKCNKYGFKISVITNANLIPIDILFYGGNKNYLKILEDHLSKTTITDKIKNSFLLADKGYKSNKLYNELQMQNTTLLIPKSKSFFPINHKEIYKNRSHIELLFAKIKNYKL